VSGASSEEYRAAASGSRFYIETWGCQMNELDSQRLAGQLMQEGLLPGRGASDADLILLNSCSVREKAEQKAYSRLGEYRLLKRSHDGLIIGFCGCVAQQEGERALRRVPELDFVLGTGRVAEIRDVLSRVRQGQRVVATGFPEERTFDFDAMSRDGLHKGMVTVIEGCDKKCTFCIVPTTRGPERSRPLEDIRSEVRHLVELGFIEIELLGQTVNHWRGSTPQGTPLDFADLLDAVAGIEGVERLRFVTSYPRDFTARMVESIARHDNICPYLHLPVQSGSDSVLRRMGRGYTRSQYLELVSALREARADLALSTDIIVGFPGESEEDFEQTLSLLEEVRFASVFAFKYSPRPGTAALHLDGEVDRETADRRLQGLFAMQARIQLELNRELVGLEHSVLITGPGKHPDTWTGRTACHRVVNVHWPETAGAPPPVGRLVKARVEQAYPHSLLAVAAGATAPRPRARLSVLEPSLESADGAGPTT
jgi:tRNA-2-methylthio-N6-dimethylallyladenosine synthase